MGIDFEKFYQRSLQEIRDGMRELIDFFAIEIFEGLTKVVKIKDTGTIKRKMKEHNRA